MEKLTPCSRQAQKHDSALRSRSSFARKYLAIVNCDVHRKKKLFAQANNNFVAFAS